MRGKEKKEQATNYSAYSADLSLFLSLFPLVPGQYRRDLALSRSPQHSGSGWAARWAPELGLATGGRSLRRFCPNPSLDGHGVWAPGDFPTMLRAGRAVSCTLLGFKILGTGALSHI